MWAFHNLLATSYKISELVWGPDYRRSVQVKHSFIPSLFFCARRENSLGTRLGHAVYLNVALVLRHFVWPRVITYHKNGKNKSNNQKQANPTSSHLSLPSARSIERPRWSRDLYRGNLTFWIQELQSVHTCVLPHIQKTMWYGCSNEQVDRTVEASTSCYHQVW